MLKSERLNTVIETVLERGTVTVTELAGELGVSEITIRRDLDELDAEKRIQRIHGGARRYTFQSFEPSFTSRQQEQIEEKAAIAAAAEQRILEEDVIALEAGTTTMELARLIGKRTWKDLTVVTNGFEIAKELFWTPGVRVIFIGGIVQLDELACFGTPAIDMIASLRFSKLFLGCRAFDIEAGLTHESDRDVPVVRAYAASADQILLLANHTKFDHRLPFRVLPAEKVDLLITDSFTPSGVLKKLENAMKVVVAPVAGSPGLN